MRIFGLISLSIPFIFVPRLHRGKPDIKLFLGLCVPCLPGQPGEFIGKIVRNHPSRSFDGYVDKEATEKKIVRDVLQPGDMWFRSGDLIFMDEFGWMYFVDRLGDTFRSVCRTSFCLFIIERLRSGQMALPIRV